MTTVQQSYRHCRQVAWRAASSFWMSLVMLPRRKRQAMYALYAFARHTDDLADSQDPVAMRRRQLTEWREQLTAVLEQAAPHPLLTAVADTVERFAIPRQFLFDVIDGVSMDLEPPRYETAEQLNEYCYHVASAVGLACIHIWGFSSEAIRQPAIQCGLAFQWTNILRDLREDGLRGRVYLPRQDLERFDVDPELLVQGRAEPRLLSLVRFEVERAEQLYRQSAGTSEYLSVEGQRVFRTMFATYGRLLEEIKRRDGDVFSRPIRLGWTGKLMIAGRQLLPGRPRIGDRPAGNRGAS